MAENEARTPYGNAPVTDADGLIVLCADDYALAPGVSEAIRALAAARRLSATSCMTLFPDWPKEAERLLPVAGEMDIGLHLTLTDYEPLGPMPRLAPNGRLPSLGRLITAAYRGHLADELMRQEIRGEVRRQLTAFTAAIGRLPDIIDGHQHIHVLPTVREEVLALFAEGLLPATTALRVPWEAARPIWRRGIARPRAFAISVLSVTLRRLARKIGLLANDSFRGVRDFRPEEDYPGFFRRFLTGEGRRPLIMCHPGHVDAELRRVDPVTECRAQEFAYFAGETFLSDLASAGRRLARVRDWHAGSPR